jgi:hypothetical protein
VCSFYFGYLGFFILVVSVFHFLLSLGLIFYFFQTTVSNRIILKINIEIELDFFSYLRNSTSGDETNEYMNSLERNVDEIDEGIETTLNATAGPVTVYQPVQRILSSESVDTRNKNVQYRDKQTKSESIQTHKQK